MAVKVKLLEVFIVQPFRPLGQLFHTDTQTKCKMIKLQPH